MGSVLFREKVNQGSASVIDVNDVENARDGLDRKVVQVLDSKTEESTGHRQPGLSGRTLRWRPKETKPTQFREDTRIWHLYLEEAEEKAQDKAELWKTGLDSLLIYAGLFASVVASFVIDIRSDLQPDREPRLLSDILNALRNSSTSNAPRIASSAYRIHGLWIISLFTTIFSAIMGVLAKAWLAKYTPAKNRGKATDAYHRYKLDRQSERWYLKEVLILAPLFVQIASVLFLAGLILQTFDDNRTIGITLLSLCVFSGIGYFSVSFFPLFIPSSPFNTPLSELLSALYTRNSDGKDRSAYKPDIDDGLGEILYYKLIMSGKSLLIDGAVAEIALPGFKPKWTDFLCKSDTPRVILSRFQECATSRTADVAQRDETLGNHLLALLSFAELYEAKLKEEIRGYRGFPSNVDEIPGAAFRLDDSVEATLVKLSDYANLDTALRDSLEPGKPLHSWNDLPDSVRPLLFALRANILTLFKLTTRRAPFDFTNRELMDRPWEMTFQRAPSGHRIHFMLAACGGLVEGERNLKMISSFILCLCLAQASLKASEAGECSEWASSLGPRQHDSVTTLSLRYLSRLNEATVLGWEDMAADTLQDMPSTVVPMAGAELPGGRALRIPRLLLLSMSRHDHRTRTHAFKMLKHWICTPKGGLDLSLATFLSGISISEVQCVVDMIVFGDHGRIQDDDLELLAKLTVVNETKIDSITSALVTSIQSALKNHEDPSARIAAMQFMGKLSQSSGCQLVVPVIAEVTSTLINLGQDDFAAERVQEVTTKLFRALRLNERSTAALKSATLEHLAQVLVQRGRRTTLHKLLGELDTVIKEESFGSDTERPLWTFPWDSPTDFRREFLDTVFDKLVDSSNVLLPSIGPQTVLKLLSESGSFRDYKKFDGLKWLEPIASGSRSWAVRYQAVSTVEMFSGQVDITTPVLNLLMKAALADDDEDVRFAALRLVSNLFKGDAIDADMVEAIKQSILNRLGLQKNFYEVYESHEKETWTALLCTVAKRVSFPEAMSIIIRMEMHEPNQLNWRPFSLFRHAYPPDRQHALLSQTVDALTSDDVNGASYFAALIEHMPPDLNVTLPATSPGALRPAAIWVRLLATMMPQFPQEFPNAPDLLIEILLHFGEEDIQRAALNGLLALGKQDLTSPRLRKSVLRNLDRITSADDWGARVALPRLLISFGDSIKLDPTGKTRTTLRNLTLENEDGRSEMVDFPSISSSGEDQSLSPPDTDTAGKDTTEMNLRLFDAGIKDTAPSPRQWWLKFAVPHIKDAASPRVASIFDVAIKDSSDLVRKDASNSLYRLLDDSKLGDSLATNLGKYIASTIKTRDNYTSATSLLVRLTSTKSRGASDVSKQGSVPARGQGEDHAHYPLEALSASLTAGHDAWIRLVMLLGKYAFQGIQKIIETAVKDEAGRDFQDLKAMLQKVKLFEQIQAELPKHLDSALRETKSNDRLEAVNLLASLLRAGNMHGLMGGPNDAHPHLMSRLAEISVKDDDTQLRTSALNLLKRLLTYCQFRESIGSCWSKPIENCLSGQGNWKYRMNAIRVLSNLTAANALGPAPVAAKRTDTVRPGDDLSPLDEFSYWLNPGSGDGRYISKLRRKALQDTQGISPEDSELDKAYATLNNIILPSIPILLKLALLVSDKGHESLRKLAEDILLENLRTYPGGATLVEEVLSAIPSMIPTITVEGKRIALRIIDTLRAPDDKALSIAHALVPLLRNPSSFSRTIAVDLLSSLYRKYRPSKPRLIESAIQEVIALALDEKDNVGEIRRTAIQLLSALSEPSNSSPGTREEDGGLAATNTPVLKPTVQLAIEFMALLQSEHLRPSVVELLSLMATQAEVRRAISLQTMAAAFGPDGSSLQGHTELVARLISDGRFANEPTDKVMLFLASAMVTRPKLSQYRFEVLTALWCRYGKEVIAPSQLKPPPIEQTTAINPAPQLEPSDTSTKQLIDWFTFAMFGRHATVYEVEKCLARSALWLPELTLEGTEVKEVP